MIKNVSVDTKSTQEKEKNINEEKNKEYEAMRNRVNVFKVYEHLKEKQEVKETEEDKEDKVIDFIRNERNFCVPSWNEQC